MTTNTTKKSSKTRTIVKHVLLKLSFLLNNLSWPEMSDSEEADKRLTKS